MYENKETTKLVKLMIKMIQQGASDCRVKHELYKVLDGDFPEVTIDSIKDEIILKEEKLENLYHKTYAEEYDWEYEDFVTLEGFVEDVENDYEY